MYDFWNIAIVVSVFFGATISPGPATVATASLAMSVGRSKALWFAAGLAFGHAIWGSLVMAGLLVGSSQLGQVTTVISAAGAVYFCWLAFGSFQSALRSQTFERNGSIGKYVVVKGIALNLLNPTIVLIWMSVLALGPAQYEQTEPLVVVFMMCALTAFVSYAIVAFVFSLSGAMRAYRSLSRVVNSCAAAIYTAAAIGLIAAAL